MGRGCRPPVVLTVSLLLVLCVAIACIPALVVALVSLEQLGEDLDTRSRALASAVMTQSDEASSSRLFYFFEQMLRMTAEESYRTIYDHFDNSNDYLNITRALFENLDVDFDTPEGLRAYATVIPHHYLASLPEPISFGIEVTKRMSQAFRDSTLVLVRPMTSPAIGSMFNTLVRWRPKQPDGSDGPVPDDLLLAFLHSYNHTKDYAAVSTAFRGLPPPPAAITTPSLYSRWNYWFANTSTLDYLDGSMSCPFTINSFYFSQDKSCTGEVVTKHWPCPEDPTDTRYYCFEALRQQRGEVLYQLSNYGPVLMMEVTFRAVNVTVTTPTSGYNSTFTHTQGVVGQAAQPGGNPYADCSWEMPCALPSPTVGFIPHVVFNDQLANIAGYTPMNQLSVTIAQRAAAQTAVLKARLPKEQAAVLDMTLAPAGGADMRVFAVSHDGTLMAVSRGDPVSATQGLLQLNQLFDDDFAAELCERMRLHTLQTFGNMTIGAAVGGEAAMRLNGPCGVPGVPRLEVIERAGPGVVYPDSFSFTFVYATVEWRVGAIRRYLPAARTHQHTAVEYCWMIVALPDTYISYHLDELRGQLVAKVDSMLADSVAASASALETTRVLLVLVVLAVLVVASVLAVVFFVAVTRSVVRLADVVASLSTLDEDGIVCALSAAGAAIPESYTRLLVAARAVSGAPSTAAAHPRAHDVEPTSPAAVAAVSAAAAVIESSQDDVREDVLQACAAWLTGSLASSPIAEVSQLATGTVTLVRSLVSLSKFVPTEVAQFYAVHGESASLHVEEVPSVVLLIVDLVGFTSFCERSKLADAMRVIADYFACMTDCVNSTNGVVDRMLGDAVLGTWDVVSSHPAPGAAALTTAINMLGFVRLRSARWDRLRCRIGIAMGSALVGNFGSVQRYQHGVFGPVVQLVEAMESGNTRLGTTVLLPGAMVDADDTLREAFPLRLAGRLGVSASAAGVMRSIGGNDGTPYTPPTREGNKCCIDVYELFLADELYLRAAKAGALSAPPREPLRSFTEDSRSQPRVVHVRGVEGRTTRDDDIMTRLSDVTSVPSPVSRTVQRFSASDTAANAQLVLAPRSSVASGRASGRWAANDRSRAGTSRSHGTDGSGSVHASVRFAHLLRYTVPLDMPLPTLLTEDERTVLRLANFAMSLFLSSRWKDASIAASEAQASVAKTSTSFAHIATMLERMKLLADEALSMPTDGVRQTLDPNSLFLPA